MKLLRGNPGKRPLRPEPEPTREPQCPDPPLFVVGYAADESWRVAPELHRLGLLTFVDTAVLAAYCQSYSRWRTAEEVLASMAEKDSPEGPDDSPRAGPRPRVEPRKRRGENCNLLPKLLPNDRFCLIAKRPKSAIRY